MIFLWIYLSIAGILAVIFFIKSLYEIDNNERKQLTYKDYIGAMITCILVVGLLWPVSWVLWLSDKK